MVYQLAQSPLCAPGSVRDPVLRATRAPVAGPISQHTRRFIGFSRFKGKESMKLRGRQNWWRDRGGTGVEGVESG